MAKLVSKTYGDALFELATDENKIDSLFEEAMEFFKKEDYVSSKDLLVNFDDLFGNLYGEYGGYIFDYRPIIKEYFSLALKIFYGVFMTSKERAQEINALINEMTLEEKVSLMLHESMAVSRLNIPEYNWWNEGLHGVARAGYATIFPQTIGLAATFDIDLVQKQYEAINTDTPKNITTEDIIIIKIMIIIL